MFLKFPKVQRRDVVRALAMCGLLVIGVSVAERALAETADPADCTEWPDDLWIEPESGAMLAFAPAPFPKPVRRVYMINQITFRNLSSSGPLTIRLKLDQDEELQFQVPKGGQHVLTLNPARRMNTPMVITCPDGIDSEYNRNASTPQQGKVVYDLTDGLIISGR